MKRMLKLERAVTMTVGRNRETVGIEEEACWQWNLALLCGRGDRPERALVASERVYRELDYTRWQLAAMVQTQSYEKVTRKWKVMVRQSRCKLAGNDFATFGSFVSVVVGVETISEKQWRTGGTWICFSIQIQSGEGVRIVWNCLRMTVEVSQTPGESKSRKRAPTWLVMASGKQNRRQGLRMDDPLQKQHRSNWIYV